MVQAIPTHGSPGTGRNLQLYLSDISGDLTLKNIPPLIYRARLNGIITITATIRGWNVSNCEAIVVYDREYLKIVQGFDTVAVPVTIEGSNVSWGFQTLKQTPLLEIKVKAEANGLSQQINAIMEVV